MEFRKNTELTEVHRIVGGEVEAENIIGTNGNIYHLENIVAVCGIDYCMMTSYRCKKDLCSKVYKINDNVMVGATGTFRIEENPLEPLIGARVKAISLEELTMLIEDYMVDRRTCASIYPDRKYIIAGREYDGQFCIVSIEFIDNHKELHRSVYRPNKEAIAAVLSAPRYFSDDKSEFFELFKKGLRACNDVAELRKYIELVTRKLSSVECSQRDLLDCETRIVV